MRYKHVIWDYDGTLFDSYPVMASAFSAALLERGILEPADAVVSYLKVSMGCAAKHYKEQYGLDDAFFERLKALRQEAEAENTRPFDGAIELCRAICENGGKNYLFTHRGRSAVHFIEKFGLTAYFTELITSEQNFPRKPSPEAIEYLIKKHSFSCDEALMLGDRELDMLSARNAGIHACYFCGDGEPPKMAEYSIAHFSKCYEIIEISSAG